MFSSNFLVFLQHVTIRRMAWTVENHVVTVATGNHVITWTEVVHSDVTMGCLDLNVLQVFALIMVNIFNQYILYFLVSVK